MGFESLAQKPVDFLSDLFFEPLLGAGDNVDDAVFEGLFENMSVRLARTGVAFRISYRLDYLQRIKKCRFQTGGFGMVLGRCQYRVPGESIWPFWAYDLTTLISSISFITKSLSSFVTLVNNVPHSRTRIN